MYIQEITTMYFNPGVEVRVGRNLKLQEFRGTRCLTYQRTVTIQAQGYKTPFVPNTDEYNYFFLLKNVIMPTIGGK